MSERRGFADVRTFVLVTCSTSWPIFLVVDAWLVPGLLRQERMAAVWLVSLFGHMLAMAGPALGATVAWRRHGGLRVGLWDWGRPRHYAVALLPMLALWAVPALAGLGSGAYHLRSPLPPYVWVVVAASATLGWLAGLGEETGWSAYLLPRLWPSIGRSRALLVAGVIRGLWHWPLLMGPVVAQVVSGERSLIYLCIMGVVLAIQLAASNVAFGIVFGWVWYRTGSLPLMAWVHQWFDATRDLSALFVVGYAGSRWFTTLWGMVLALVAAVVLMKVAREEGADGWTLAPRFRGAAVGGEECRPTDGRPSRLP